MPFTIGNKLWTRKKKFKHTKESIAKIKIARAKQVITEEHKKRIGIGVKNSPFYQRIIKGLSYGHGWNKGKRNWWNVGIPRTEDIKRKIGDAQRGTKNHNWKNGITPLRNKIYKSNEWKTWRNRIFRRDEYTCKNCGLNGGRLEADHFKIKFCDLLKKYKVKSLIDIKKHKSMWDISLGRTLCRECHIKTPNYGNKHNKK